MRSTALPKISGVTIITLACLVPLSFHLLWVSEYAVDFNEITQKIDTPGAVVTETHASSQQDKAVSENEKITHRAADISPRGKLNGTELLGLFSAEKAPIMMGTPIPPERPVRIRILLFEHKTRNISFRPGPTAPISDEVLNIVMDGLDRSPHLELVNWTVVPDFTVEPDFVLSEVQGDDDMIVWVADMRRIVFGHSYTITRQLVHLANSTLQYHQTHKTVAPTIRVVLMDFRDRIRAQTFCTKSVMELRELLGEGNVRLVLQQVIQGRHWSDRVQFPVTGTVRDSRHDAECFGSPVIHIPYTVRSDYAEEALTLYPFLLSNRTKEDSSNLTPVDTLRPVDAAHFWPERGPGAHAKLRNKVSELLVSMRNETNLDTNRRRPWKIIADFVSAAATEGRSQISSSYLKTLLTTKIVVVAQRDDWEDHYRLFEAFVGGALVMTDPMWTLPGGMVDGDSIVVYKSLKHLRELLGYYLDPRHEHERLEIARKGWKVAMTRHRTVHCMERIFFGRSLSAT